MLSNTKLKRAIRLRTLNGGAADEQSIRTDHMGGARAKSRAGWRGAAPSSSSSAAPPDVGVTSAQLDAAFQATRAQLQAQHSVENAHMLAVHAAATAPRTVEEEEAVARGRLVHERQRAQMISDYDAINAHMKTDFDASTAHAASDAARLQLLADYGVAYDARQAMIIRALHSMDTAWRARPGRRLGRSVALGLRCFFESQRIERKRLDDHEPASADWSAPSMALVARGPTTMGGWFG